jgi:hypothetical protein
MYNNGPLFKLNIMNKTTKAASLGIMMFAMTGLIGFSMPDASAVGVGSGGYQLNLLGKHWEKDTINCDNNGHKIFVPLNGKFKINLSEGDFAVTDCNATDDKVAGFQLPNPIDLDGDGVTDAGLGCDPQGTDDPTCTIGYAVYARALGAQGASIEIGPTCAQADLDGDGVLEDYCTTDDLITLESKAGKGGGAKFTNVSKELLTICVDFLTVDTDGDGVPDEGDGKCDRRIALFDDDFENFMWNFDNNGARNTQLRFVIETQIVG